MCYNIAKNVDLIDFIIYKGELMIDFSVSEIGFIILNILKINIIKIIPP